MTASSGLPRSAAPVYQRWVIRRKYGVRAHLQRLRALLGQEIHQADEAQAEQPGELHEAQPHRPAAEDQDVVARPEVEVAEGGVDLAPGAEQHRRFHRDGRRHGAHDLVDLVPAVRRIRHAVLDHGRVIAGQDVLREAAPPAGVGRIGRVQQQPADHPIADLEAAHLLADGGHDPGVFVAEQQGIVFNPGEVTLDEFPIGGVAQARGL